MTHYTSKSTAPIKFHNFLRVVVIFGIIADSIDFLSACRTIFSSFIVFLLGAPLILINYLMLHPASIALRVIFFIGARKWAKYTPYCIISFYYLNILIAVVSELINYLYFSSGDFIMLSVQIVVYTVFAIIIHRYYLKRMALFDGLEAPPQPYVPPLYNSEEPVHTAKKAPAASVPVPEKAEEIGSALERYAKLIEKDSE